jgi:hypothetical protein
MVMTRTQTFFVLDATVHEPTRLRRGKILRTSIDEGVVKSSEIGYSTGIAGVSRLDTPVCVSGSWRKRMHPRLAFGGMREPVAIQHPVESERQRAPARPAHLTE